MNQRKPRRFDSTPLLSLKILSRDGVIIKVKDKPLKDFHDLEELFETIKQKI